jgi:hypothetical protein
MQASATICGSQTGWRASGWKTVADATPKKGRPKAALLLAGYAHRV